MGAGLGAVVGCDEGGRDDRSKGGSVGLSPAITSCWLDDGEDFRLCF